MFNQPALVIALPNFLFFRDSKTEEVEFKVESESRFQFNPKLLLPILLLVALIVVCLFIQNNQKNELMPIPKSDTELVQELDQSFNTFKNSFSHLSAAARTCATNPKSKACELLEKAYGQFLTEGYQAPLTTPTNIKIRQLGRDQRIFPMIAYVLRAKNKEVGRILSTDRIFDLGKEYFLKLVEKKRLSLTVDIRNIEWILLLQGYSLEQWAKNQGYKDVKNLRPQFEKVPADRPVTDLFTGSTTQDKLRRAGFSTIQDVIDFINEHKSNWEIEIRERGVGLPQIKDLKDALIDAGHEDVVNKYERQ